jgi:outer membrane protein
MDLLYAEAGFNPELYGDAGYGRSQSPARNAFQPEVERTTTDATLGWRQRVVTGGLFDLAFNPARYTNNSSATSGGVSVFPDEQNAAIWNLSYTQPLLRSAWSDYNLGNIDIARHNVRRSEQEFDRSVQDTLLRIVESYWELVYTRENYRVVIEALAVAREQLRITEERIRVRELAPRDRVADEAEVARREEERIAAENDIRRREDDLRRLLFDDQRGDLWRWNLRPTEPIEVTPPTDEIPYEPLVDQALQHRPDIAAMRSAVAEAEVLQMKADRDTLPQLDLVSTYSSDGVREGSSFANAFYDANDQQYPDWGLRLQFSVPIGNQAARARLQRARIEVEQRQRMLYGAIMDVAKEVRAAVRNLKSYAQSIQASAVSVRLAETNLETEQVKLRVGSSTAFEVQRRNQDLRTARSRHLRNQLDYRAAQSRLQHAQGLLSVPLD